MNVDRTKFLLLTGAIAAATVVAAGAGCNTVTESGSDAGNGTDTGIETDSGGDSSSDAAADADGGTACLDDTLPSTEGGDAGVDADTDADTDAGPIGACGGPDTNGCGNLCGGEIDPHFKKGVAAAIDKCLLTVPQCETASVEAEGCIEDALDQACPDPTADSFCTPLVTACNADAGDAGDADGGTDKLFTQVNCVKIAQGLNQAGRDAFQICINEGVSGSCTLDPDFCVKSVMHIP